MAIIWLGRASPSFFAAHARSLSAVSSGARPRFPLTNDHVGVDGVRICIPNLAVRWQGHVGHELPLGRAPVRQRRPTTPATILILSKPKTKAELE
jgi:hypothetical protein